MKLSEFKNKLTTIDELVFLKLDGTIVPKHFHITEVGQITKKFIDCGGTVREENVVSMQLWESIDVWHRLQPSKLISIIDLSIQKLGIEDHEVEIEYQNETIGKYNIEYRNGSFQLLSTQTNCLAIDQCVTSAITETIQTIKSSCSPGGGCC